MYRYYCMFFFIITRPTYYNYNCINTLSNVLCKFFSRFWLFFIKTMQWDQFDNYRKWFWRNVSNFELKFCIFTAKRNWFCASSKKFALVQIMTFSTEFYFSNHLQKVLFQTRCTAISKYLNFHAQFNEIISFSQGSSIETIRKSSNWDVLWRTCRNSF